MPVALVLGGGGARGDFEVGAVRYLYEQGIRPDIICGTSVGSINGAKLAEGEGAPDQGLSGLEAIWRGLRVNADMFEEQPWLARINDQVKGVLTQDAGSADGEFVSSAWGSVAQFLNWGYGLAANEAAGNAFRRLFVEPSIYNLNPIARRLRGAPDGTGAQLSLQRIAAWSNSGRRKLRLAAVALESGRLRYITETGQLIERNGQPATSRRLAATCQRIADDIVVLHDQRREVQAELSFAAPSDKPALVRKIRDLNLQIGRRNRDLAACNLANPPGQQPVPPVGLVDGVLASASMPFVFPPISLGGENYVDGGVREIVPVQAAVSLGADTIYAIAASSLTPDAQGSFARAGAFPILLRSLAGLALDEVVNDDISPPGGWGPGRTVTVIAPRFNLHDPLVIDPGLVSIAMAYGYMCSADVYRRIPLDSELTGLADQITLLRRDIWRLECIRFGKPVPGKPIEPAEAPNPAVMPELSARKQELKSLIDRRRQLGGVLPSDADQWPQVWEGHPWDPGSITLRNGAAFVAISAIPGSIEPGRQQAVSVTMRNSGESIWSPGRGYRLGLIRPQDAAHIWGIARVELPGSAFGPSAEVKFDFRITAPASVGTYDFQWQMVQDGVEWFGEPMPLRQIYVEPASCIPIRGQIAAIRGQIRPLQDQRRELQEELKTAPAQDRPRIVSEINRLNTQIAAKERQIDDLERNGRGQGCQL